MSDQKPTYDELATALERLAATITHLQKVEDDYKRSGDEWFDWDDASEAIFYECREALKVLAMLKAKDES
jgi:hypothetical protein